MSSKKHGERGAIYQMPDGTKYIVLSNKEGMYVARPGELVDLTNEYSYILALTENALQLFYATEASPHH